jgi:hypothetical protein
MCRYRYTCLGARPPSVPQASAALSGDRSPIPSSVPRGFLARRAPGGKCERTDQSGRSLMDELRSAWAVGRPLGDGDRSDARLSENADEP